MKGQFEYEVIAVNGGTIEGERKGFHTDRETIKAARELAQKYDRFSSACRSTIHHPGANSKWLQFKIGGKIIFDLPESDNVHTS